MLSQVALNSRDNERCCVKNQGTAETKCFLESPPVDGIFALDCAPAYSRK
jgi:hypothetical protein